MQEAWTIQMFGGLRLCGAGHTQTRFRTQKTAALLARLAYPPLRPHAREELIGWLWPEAAEEDGRRSLRVALNSLRHQLEPPPIPAGSILRADRLHVGLDAGAVRTDVAALEDALGAATRAATPEDRRTHLATAVSRYGGPLLPGFYEDWVLTERERHTQAYLAALLELAAADSPAALDHSLRALAADPLCEEAHARIIRVHMAEGRPAEARRRFAEYERLMREELDAPPSEAVRALLDVAPGPPRRSSPAPMPRVKVTAPLSPAPSFTPASLPPTFTRFIGRQEELNAVAAALAAPDARLLTLTGPGGAGKTRLAIETARREADGGRRAVVFAPLADVTDSGLLPAALLAGLGGARDEAGEPWDVLCARLGAHPTLLVLDNLEQLLPGAAALVERLLASLPDLDCLVTSRQRVGVEAEREYPVPPLPTPGADATPESLSACDGVRLFVDRAQAVRPDFQVTASNAEALGELTRRLEGLPLAIELAAAHARALTPRQMVWQLEQRFAFLVSPRRGGVERHRSLRAALEWSHGLLPPELQRAFRELSVFRGGWTVGAAEAVCREAGALGALERLQECSLVQAAEAGEEMRYRMLDAVREFGQERLTSDDGAAVRRRHADWCLALAEQAEPGLSGRDSARWLERLTAERENLRAALDWSEAAAPDLALRLAGALAPFWLASGDVLEGERRLDNALGRRAAAPPAVRAKLLFAAGLFATFRNALAAGRGHIEESLALYREIGDTARAADAARELGLLLEYHRGPDAAGPLFAQSLDLSRIHGDAEGVAQALQAAAGASLRRGDVTAARPLLDEALALRRRQGVTAKIGGVVCSLASAAELQGEHARARGLWEEGLATMRAAGEWIGAAYCLRSLAGLASVRGDLPAAEALLREAEEVARGAHSRAGVAVAIESLGSLAAERGDVAEARTRFDESLALWQEMGNRCGMGRVLGTHLGGLALEHLDLGEARRLREQMRELLSSFGNQWDAAVAAHALAAVVAAQGDQAGARALLTESLDAIRGWPPSINLADLWQGHALIRRELGELGEARALQERSLALCRDYGLRPASAEALTDLAGTTFKAGGPRRATEQYREAVALWRDVGDVAELGRCLEGLAEVLTACGRASTAATLLGAADSWRRASGRVRSPRAEAQHRARLGPLRAAIGPAAFDDAWADGSRMSPEEAAALALKKDKVDAPGRVTRAVTPV